jgi:hypothetical protein
MKKLTLLYTFWTGDDVEMLMRSIKHHKPFVDEIIICLQETSNKGQFNLIRSDLVDYNNMVKLGFNLINYEPDLSLSTKENERIKHNKMIQEAKKRGATHFIMAAADHFYSEQVFNRANRVIGKYKMDVVLTKMRTFYKQENWCLEPIEDYYMPFIHKMYPNTEISKDAKYPVLVDPSVKVNTFNHNYLMPESEGLMNHYSMVRKDIKKKLKNAAASIRWTPEQVERFISEYENAKPGDKIEYFGGRKLIDINN